MSLACLALRLITRRALEERTLAGGRIRDSELAPLSSLLETQGDAATGPVISIYIDQTGADVEGRQLFSGSGTVNLLFEIAADTSVSEDNIEIPATSAGLETTLDVIAYQIKAALLDGGSRWGDLWGRLVASVKRVDTLRGADFLKTGTRFAARQINMELTLLNDPVPGDEPEWVWSQIFETLAADPEFDDVAAMLRAVVAGQPLPAWRRDMIEVGDTFGDAVAMGYAHLSAEA